MTAASRAASPCRRTRCCPSRARGSGGPVGEGGAPPRSRIVYRVLDLRLPRRDPDDGGRHALRPRLRLPLGRGRAPGASTIPPSRPPPRASATGWPGLRVLRVGRDRAGVRRGEVHLGRPDDRGLQPPPPGRRPAAGGLGHPALEPGALDRPGPRRGGGPARPRGLLGRRGRTAAASPGWTWSATRARSGTPARPLVDELGARRLRSRPPSALLVTARTRPRERWTALREFYRAARTPPRHQRPVPPESWSERRRRRSRSSATSPTRWASAPTTATRIPRRAYPASSRGPRRAAGGPRRRRGGAEVPARRTRSRGSRCAPPTSTAPDLPECRYVVVGARRPRRRRHRRWPAYLGRPAPVGGDLRGLATPGRDYTVGRSRWSWTGDRPRTARDPACSRHGRRRTTDGHPAHPPPQLAALRLRPLPHRRRAEPDLRRHADRQPGPRQPLRLRRLRDRVGGGPGASAGATPRA